MAVEAVVVAFVVVEVAVVVAINVAVVAIVIFINEAVVAVVIAHPKYRIYFRKLTDLTVVGILLVY